MASKIEQIRSLIDGTHVMGDLNGLREYHAARAVRDANRCGTTDSRFAAMRKALKNYRVSVTREPGSSTIRIRNHATGAEYLAHS